MKDNIKQSKISEVEKLANVLNRSKVLILTEYRGLSVLEITELRKKLRETATYYKVVKNTYAKRAFKSAHFASKDNDLSATMEKLLKGPVAMAFNYDDPMTPAKILKEFGREHENLKIKGGIMAGRILTTDDINMLANLPCREVLIAKVVTGMKGPINNLVFTLKGIISKFIFTLEAIKSQKK